MIDCTVIDLLRAGAATGFKRVQDQNSTGIGIVEFNANFTNRFLSGEALAASSRDEFRNDYDLGF